MTDGGDPIDDRALRARNIKLGLLVGGFALVVMLAALIRFVVFGLPEDRKAYEQMEQRRSAEVGAGNEDSVDD